MSMTREEIIQEYEGAVVANGLAAAAGNEDAMKSYELFKAGLDALRPIRREQVEKVWRGEWREEIVNKCDWKGKKREYYQPHSCSKCHRADPGEGKSKFCSHCGAPMTDEAVQMVMERLEALYDTEN